jgi:hypothetical protein
LGFPGQKLNQNPEQKGDTLIPPSQLPK